MGEPVLLLTAGHRDLEKVQVTGGDQIDEKHVVVVDSRDFDAFVGVKEPCAMSSGHDTRPAKSRVMNRCSSTRPMGSQRDQIRPTLRKTRRSFGDCSVLS